MNLESVKRDIRRALCEDDHLYFTRYFFKLRQGIKFRINWHHEFIADSLQAVIDGKIKNLIITVPPGSSKTEAAVISFIARGLALNPRARFLHLSGSDSLASLNSATARDIVRSDEFQSLWPTAIHEDSDSKKRWNVVIDSAGRTAGGVYATSIGGQVTGFRAGHMAEGFQGAIIIDDPLKPEDAYSKVKLAAGNRRLLTTMKSRKANPDTPIILIMQRLSQHDPVAFIEGPDKTHAAEPIYTFRSRTFDGLEFTRVKIPAVLTDEYVEKLPEKYRRLIDKSAPRSIDGRFSYWAYKEPIDQLIAMERGEGVDQEGARVSRHVFTSQYQQEPVALGGNLIHGAHLVRYKVLPRIKYRKIFADTAQKTKEHNDYSVFGCFGVGEDNRLYLLDLLRGKWEAPELKRRANEFWRKHAALTSPDLGPLREMKVEDKSSGTDLVQTMKLPPYNIPVKPIERGPDRDKLMRVMDAVPYVEAGQVCIPEDAPFTSDFVSECESFTPDDTHDFDDQVDVLCDAVMDLLSSQNTVKRWEACADNGPTRGEGTPNVRSKGEQLLERYRRRKQGSTNPEAPGDIPGSANA